MPTTSRHHREHPSSPGLNVGVWSLRVCKSESSRTRECQQQTSDFFHLKITRTDADETDVTVCVCVCARFKSQDTLGTPIESID